MVIALRHGGKQLGYVLEPLYAVTGLSLLMFSVSSHISLRLVSQSSPPLRWLTQNWHLIFVDLFVHALEIGAHLATGNYFNNTGRQMISGLKTMLIKVLMLVKI